MKLLNADRIALIRTRAAAEFAQYLLTGAHGQYEVSRKGTTRRYSVDLNARRCGCPAFEKESYCKHAAMCQIEEENRSIEARAAMFAELEAGRYERDAARLDRMESTPRNIFPVNTIPQYHAAMNRSDLTRDELSGLHAEYDRLFKHTI